MPVKKKKKKAVAASRSNRYVPFHTLIKDRVVAPLMFTVVDKYQPQSVKEFTAGLASEGVIISETNVRAWMKDCGIQYTQRVVFETPPRAEFIEGDGVDQPPPGAMGDPTPPDPDGFAFDNEAVTPTGVVPGVGGDTFIPMG